MSSRRNDDSESPRPSLDDAIREMKSEDSIPSPTVLYGLSDLQPDDLERFKPVWDNLDPTYRRILMQMLADIAETDFELMYSPIGFANLDSPDSLIRQAAIEILNTDESPALMHQLRSIARNDPDEHVRIEAIRSLGRFVLLGEWGELSEEEIAQVQDELVSFYKDTSESIELRSISLESVANCTRDDVQQFISSAYNSQDATLRLSAIVAMGRSCDSQWENIILKELQTNDRDIQRAAIRAAGDIQIEEAVPRIVELLKEDEPDFLEVSIWALGEIGSREAVRILERMLAEYEDSDDENIIEWLDDAISNASLSRGDFMMLDFGTEEE